MVPVGDAWVAASATLCGAIRLGTRASVWFGAVIRAEQHEVKVGDFSNVQDHVVIHIGERTGVFVGNHCSIAHRATLHGCHVEDNVLVGIGATVMDGCVIGESSVVASHALVPPGTIVPPCSVVMGVPGRVVRRHDSFVENRVNAFLYWRNAMAYAAGQHRLWEELAFRDELERELERLRAEEADGRTAQSR